MNCTKRHFEQYDHYLSTFGKKVLKNLITHFYERDECNKVLARRRFSYGQSKQILNFGEPCHSPYMNACQQNVLLNECHDNADVNNRLPCIDTSYNNNSSMVASSLDIKTTAAVDVTQTYNGQACMKMQEDVLKHPETLRSITEEGHNATFTAEIPTVTECLEWDVFDTQLLTDLNVLDTSLNNGQKETEKDESIQFSAEYECYRKKNKKLTKSLDAKNIIDKDSRNILSDFHRTLVQKTNGAMYDNDIESNVSKIVLKNKKKHSNLNKIAISMPKKTKKLPVEVAKTSFHKQESMKSVRTWLTNVEHKNLVTVLDLQKNKEVSSNLEEKKNLKKIVQAQLMIKGGKMKFGKPK